MRRLAVTALAAALAAAVAPAAQANGDPASDYLPSADVFLSFSEGVRETPSGKRLLETVASANKGGYRIKVAVIATPTDLGTVGGLFGEPQRYAEFLGQEISFVYRDRLLIAMPAGFGIYDAGRPVAREQAVLKRVTIGPGIAGLDDAAAGAVAALSGRPVAEEGAGSGWYSSAWFLALVAGCTVAAIAAGFLLGRRWLARAA
jgi:hypothetical protein